ncbi:TRAP transporter small permease subunit [uncultured Sulfitobacter sp.]|jgi:TRAP-type transport system small permease protein|uniref:TRAP transporter small permease n=1 Tax=uncultured Sulfitobacter sp. TaxID=191468 RepID=UPI0030F89ED9
MNPTLSLTDRPLIKVLIQVPIWLACLSLFTLMVMTFCDVVLRSSFDAPIEEGTELTRIFVAVMVFSVMPLVSVTGGHIAVDLTDGFFAKMGLSRIRDGLISLACALMMVWPVLRVWALAERTRDFGDVTQYLGVPQYLVMYFIAFFITVTALAMAVAGVLTLFLRPANQRNPL